MNKTRTATTGISGAETTGSTNTGAVNAVNPRSDFPEAGPSLSVLAAAAAHQDDGMAVPGTTHRLGPGPQIPASLQRRFLGMTLGGSVILALVLYLGWTYFAYARSWVKTDNAFLATHIHSISSRVAGTVQDVLVDDNQAVAAGQLLARLDPKDLSVQRQEALAQVAQARAQVQEATARIAQAEAQVAREQARLTKARNDLARANSLYEGGSGAISKQELELARADSDAAEAARRGADSALDSATASAAAAAAQEKVALASLDNAELQLSYAEIVAPASGRIGKKNLEVGNRLQPGQVVIALVQTDLWVTANFKETQLTRLRPGQVARVEVDAFPGHVFVGRVDSFSPGSGAQFALLPPDNATGNFTKIVQRVPVKIVLDQASLGDCGGRLVAGMSALVEVKVRD